MGRMKKIEEGSDANEVIMEDTVLDVTPPEETKQEISLSKKDQKPVDTDLNHHTYMKEEPINCLRNERIIVRFVPSPTAMVQRKGHILYGGMSENATRSFVVPRLSKTGVFKNVLTNNEKDFLERAMGLELGALSVHRKENNFWDDSNPNGIGRVTLHNIRFCLPTRTRLHLPCRNLRTDQRQPISL